ncbi:hypothetical protein BDW59DRAFT_29542 [Aspergillus cavernicola]|uniref:Uncharacterized protein n=1 Tax=Aspergillus cavernicola TaxID=176166 RepID=A0ABR4IQI7_9EURO
MDTITHAVQNAGNAIWNEVDALRGTGEQQTAGQGVEPISGIQGKGTVDDPYDAGNRDEQPNAPETNSNTAVMTEPVPSTIPDLSKSHTATQGSSENENAALATSSLGPTNPTVNHPTSVQSPQKTGYGPGASTAGKSTLKDEHIRSLGARTTLKDESITKARDVSADETPTVVPAPAAAAVSAATNNTNTQERQSEQRNESITAYSLNQKKSLAGEPEQRDQSTAFQGLDQTKSQVGASEQRNKSTTSQSLNQSEDKNDNQEGDTSGAAPPTTPHKQKVSEEALKGPKCPPPRDSYDKDKKVEGGLRKKSEDQKQGGQPKTEKSEGKSDDKKEKSHHHGKDTKSKETDDHPHKSMKEKISNIMHVGHHH